MSALGDIVLATPGLIAALEFEENVGAGVPAVSGPNSGTLTATYNGSAAPNATPIIPGDARSLTIPANGYVDIAANALLRPTADLCVEIFCTIGTLPTGDTNLVGVATAYNSGDNIQAVIRSNGRYMGRVNDATPTTIQHADYLDSPTGLVHVVVFRRGSEVHLVVNGGRRLAVNNWFSNTATRTASSPFRVGGAVNGLAMTVGRAALYGRALTYGEIRARMEAAGISRGTVDSPSEYSAKRRSKAINSAPTIYDGGTGLKMTSGERYVIDANNSTWHPATYAAVKPGTATTLPTSSSTRDEVGTHAGRMLLDAMNIWGVRQTSSDGNYFAPVAGTPRQAQWINGVAQTGEVQRTLGLAWGAAALLRGGGGAQDDVLYDMAVRTCEYAYSLQAADGGINTADQTGTRFTGNQLCIIYRLLEPWLDSARKARWKAALIKIGTYEFNNGFTSWYANGNLELKSVGIFQHLYAITGDSLWQTRMEAKLTHAQTPTGTYGGKPSDGTLFGWVEVTPATLPDGSDGVGYFKESNGTTAGLDYNYASYQAMIAANIYTHSGDIRFLKIANMCFNVVQNRFTKNTTSFWTLDGTGGVRMNNALLPCDSSIFALLAWRGGRTALAADAGAMMKSYGYTFGVNPNGNGGIYRAMGEGVGEIYMAARGTPTV